MARSWPYFFLVLWFAFLISTSILLFTGGFLLNRVVSTTNATCTPLQIRSCTPSKSHLQGLGDNSFDSYCTEDDRQILMNNLHGALNYCLYQKSKVVLIIIDALHYNFAKFDESVAEPAAYQNKMPTIYNLLKQYPTSTRLYKFIADPPTTTMQRLKALTTGSLPTFIDAGSNFASAEITEDNIIDQINKNKNGIVFMGDDTWTSLYPNRFLRSYPFPSFNVFDLDTVDNGINKHLYKELTNNDWDLLIAHFLGVDHCGHRYGPMHLEMSRKLTEMDNVVKKVVQNLGDDTILFVIGDHGMTTTGDHGGESIDEVTSAMFVYSKNPLIEFNANNDGAVRQIDLVPTISTILGLPIPYSNLGTVITNSLVYLNNTETPFPMWHFTLFSLWSNVQQISQYIKDYATSTEIFSTEHLKSLNEKHALLNARVRTLSNENDYKRFKVDAEAYTTALRNMCEEVWVQFDSFAMSRGLVLIFITIFLVYLLVSGIPKHQLPDIFESSFLPCSYFALLVAASVSIALFYFEWVENLHATVYFATGLTSIFMLSVLVIQNWEVIAIHWYSVSSNSTAVDLIYRLAFLLSWSGLLSNSYIVEEGNVSLFLLLTVLLLKIYEHNSYTNNTNTSDNVPAPKLKANSMKMKLLSMVLLACLILRISTHFWRCREEQQWCFKNFSAHSGTTTPASKIGKIEYLLTLISIAVFVTATRNWLRSCGNLSGFSLSVFFIRYAPTVIVVATGGFWVLHKLPKDAKHKLIGSWQADSLAWVVYFFVAVGIISIIFQPLCIYMMPSRKNSPMYTKSKNVIPQLFKHVKGLFNEPCHDNNERIPVIYGLATVYSAAFITVSIYVCLLVSLLLGDVLAPSVILMYFSACIILVFIVITRLDNLNSPGELFEVSNTSVFIWMLLSLHFFYASGHQPTFPNIAWEAAFVGTGGIFSNNIIPGMLVVFNTFGSYIIMGITLPLLFIAPFTLSVVYPSLLPKHLQKELSQGEIIMFENEEMMLTNVFMMTCKYILYHACRVFISMLAATIHCRHLMVWKIFAPKLIFESIGMFVTLTSAILGYLLLITVNSKVNNLITRLTKQCR